MRTLLAIIVVAGGVSVANAECRSYKSPDKLNEPITLHIRGDTAYFVREQIGDELTYIPCDNEPDVRCYGAHGTLFFRVARPNDYGAWIKFVAIDNGREHLWEAACDGVVN